MARIEITGGESTYSLLPDGTYDLQIDAAEIKQAKSSGNNQLQLSCHVVDGPHDGKKCTVFYSLVEKSGWKTKLLLEAVGIEFDQEETTLEDGKPGFKLGFDTDDLLGGYVRYDVGNRKHDGKDRNSFNNEAVSPMTQFEDGAAPTPGNGGAAAATAAAAAPVAQAAQAAAAAPQRRRRVAPQQQS